MAFGRSNLAFAALTLKQDLHLSNTQCVPGLKCCAGRSSPRSSARAPACHHELLGSGPAPVPWHRYSGSYRRAWGCRYGLGAAVFFIAYCIAQL